MNRENHRQAAREQDERVDAADPKIEMPAGDFEGGRVFDSVDGVAGKNAAEDQDFGCEKHPHAEQRCLLLVLEALEVVPMGGGVATGHVR